MIDPKRLIESMELCMSAERDCHKCTYCETENDCRDSMIYDALELLKEQEKVSVVYTMMDTECGNCGCYLDKTYSICPKCGKRLDWNAGQG